MDDGVAVAESEVFGFGFQVFWKGRPLEVVELVKIVDFVGVQRLGVDIFGE